MGFRSLVSLTIPKNCFPLDKIRKKVLFKVLIPYLLQLAVQPVTLALMFQNLICLKGSCLQGAVSLLIFPVIFRTALQRIMRPSVIRPSLLFHVTIQVQNLGSQGGHSCCNLLPNSSHILNHSQARIDSLVHSLIHSLVQPFTHLFTQRHPYIEPTLSIIGQSLERK